MLKKLTLDDLRTTSEEPVRVGATLSAELHRELMSFCDEQSISVSEIVRAAVQNLLVEWKDVKPIPAKERPTPSKNRA